MNVYHGDIWDLHADGAWAVIPTNIGWNKWGTAVMGAGLAGQARERFKGLDAKYGRWLQEKRENAGITSVLDARLILFPTKPLNGFVPHLSWKNRASPALIERCLVELAERAAMPGSPDCIAVPLLGAGLGGLHPQIARQLIEKHLTSPKFIRVEQVAT